MVFSLFSIHFMNLNIEKRTNFHIYVCLGICFDYKIHLYPVWRLFPILGKSTFNLFSLNWVGHVSWWVATIFNIITKMPLYSCSLKMKTQNDLFIFCIQIHFFGYWKWKLNTNSKTKRVFYWWVPLKTENKNKIHHFFN